VPAPIIVHHTAASSRYQVLYSFGRNDDGARPDAGLLDVNGTLYGTTWYGGKYGYGAVFSVSAAGEERVLYSFRSGDDGAQPNTSLIDVNGTLYGTTFYGGGYGAGGDGTVFSISTAGIEHVLHSFGSGSDGVEPTGLTDASGTIYGTTGIGGTYNWGTVFTISAAGYYHVLYSFTGLSGGAPGGSLIDVKGTLYGTTAFGGKYGDEFGGDGTVFSISTAGMEHVLHNFGHGSDGLYPAASLIDVKGTLYGTTASGGEYGSSGGGGTVFSISTAGKERVLHNFGSGSDGEYPEASLLDVNGTLYGTTWFGGKYEPRSGGGGTVFSISTASKEHVLHNFGNGSDGTEPRASLIHIKGTLYGTTYAGGTYRYGTVFALHL